MKQFVLLIVGMLVAAAIASSGAQAQISSDPPVYTWEEAVALGLPQVEEHFAPPGMPYCDVVNYNFEGLGEESGGPPDDGTECAARPEQEGLLFPSEPVQVHFSHYGGSGSGYRHSGSYTTYYSFEGGKNLAEVSNPSVRHDTRYYGPEHFYSRIAAVTPADRAIEVGWVETNHYPATGNDQRVLTVTDKEGTQDPRQHTSWNLSVGGAYAFRAKDCSDSSEGRVCAQIWDGSKWVNIRKWSGVMRCEKTDGTGNCHLNFMQEPFTTNSTWFNINGGSDGLRMRDIKVQNRYSNWFLFDRSDYAGAWLSQTPYYLCPVYDWYHYRFYRGNGC